MCIIVLFGCCAKASRICHFLFHRYQKIANYSMSCGLLQSFWYEIQTTWVWKLILSAATTVDKFLNNQQSESTNITIWIVFMKIIRSPITLLYYFYLWLPLFWFTLFIKYIELILRISARRSPRVKNLLKHIVAFSNSGKKRFFFVLLIHYR